MSASEQSEFIENNYNYEYLVRNEVCQYWTSNPRQGDVVVNKRKGNSFVGYVVEDIYNF